MKFSKWQGLGNDFIIPEEIDFKRDNINDFAVKICDRKFGIGADGLCLLETTDKADIRMRLINSDGSEAEMCGNLIRCIAKHLYESKVIEKTEMTVETLAGIIKPKLIIENGQITNISVDMGQPRLKRSLIPVLGNEDDDIENIEIDIDGEKIVGTAVSMGNPHFVIFVDDITKIDLEKTGSKIETNKMFPKKTNVEFVEILNNNKVRMRVWERGAGITMACGTGTCATLVACVLNKKTQNSIEVVVDGGSLFLDWPDAKGSVFMTGPARKVFAGEYFI